MSSRGGYSQVHNSGTARPNGVDGDDGEFGSVEEDCDEDAGRHTFCLGNVVME